MKQVSSPGHPGFQTHQSGQWRAALLAALVHLLLFCFLWIGIRWQSKQPDAVEAEVWDMKTQEAAPLPVEPAPPPEPVAEPEPKPAPVMKEEVPKEDPEIALRQAKQRKLEEKKKEEQRLREEEDKRQAEKAAQEKKERDKLQREKELQRQKELDRQKQLEQEKLDKEKLDKKKLADQKAQQAKDKAAADKLFKEQMQRVTAQAGTVGTGGNGGNGSVARSTGNNRGDPGYAAKIAAKIRSNTNFSGADATPGNPTVEYRIELLPGGLLRGPARKLKSSGIPAFDDAVAKGIEKSAPFPADKTGEYPTLDLIYKMKEE